MEKCFQYQKRHMETAKRIVQIFKETRKPQLCGGKNKTKKQNPAWSETHKTEVFIKH